MGKKGKFFLTVGFHLIHTDKMMKLENVVATTVMFQCFRQELHSQQKCKVQDILLGFKISPYKTLTVYKGKIVT